MDELDDLKREARQVALERRSRCDPAAGRSLAKYMLAASPFDAGTVVAGIWSLPGEIDLWPLLVGLADLNHTLALPVTPRRGSPLTFRRWAPGDPLEPGRFGTMHPLGPEIEPDIILVPLLAFDRSGRRLGYGGGYYDRTLAARPTAMRIGIGFAALEVAQVPAGPHDIRLPRVATETGIIRCQDL